MGLIQAFFIVPYLLMAPIAGVMVDRYNRKLMMMASDLTAGIGTLSLLVLFATGKMELWHFYLVSILLGIGNTFQWPAYSAAISTMVSKEQYGRANGMMSLIEAGPGVLAPLLAGALLPLIGLTGIMLIDVITFVFAISTLLIVYIPQPARTQEGSEGQGNIWKEAAYGFKYIFARPSLLGLQMIFLLGNLFTGIGFALVAPMILARTGQDSLALGSAQSAGALGGLVGGVVMSVWDGFKRKIHGILLGWILYSTCSLVLGIGQTLPIWVVAVALTAAFSAIVNAFNQTIWQAKVAPDVQGRVFSVRRLISWFTNPISPIIAGLLADFVLEPAMKSHNPFSDLFAGWVGSGPGAGMGLLMVFCGLGGILAGLSGYFTPAIRNVERLLPDHDALVPASTQPVDT